MNDRSVDDLGPIDYLVVEFPAGKSNFSGDALSELKSLVDRQLVRILDLVFIRKGADGSIEAFELGEFEHEDFGGLRELGTDLAHLLALEDVDAIAEDIESDSVAAVLVWENTWAAPFASSLRRAGGQLVETGRIPMQAILAVLEANEADAQTEGA